MELMNNKKILYVHGFASSGQTGTVTTIKEYLPGAEVIAPDLPLHPAEAIANLKEICEKEQPDLIIGTSMGGMFAEQLRGFDRILVNPAFRMGETLVSNNMVGRQEYTNPRRDGQQEFIVTKALVKEFKDVTEQCFKDITPEEKERVWALFGDEDQFMSTSEEYKAHYPSAISFHGGHRMNDKTFLNSVMPVIRWIDDKREERERPTIFISIETLRDDYMHPRSSSQKTFKFLLESYNIYIVAPVGRENSGQMDDDRSWADEHINVPAYRHILFTDSPELLMGDYLISSLPSSGRFLGTAVEFGSPDFKSWDDIHRYFELLGGQ